MGIRLSFGSLWWRLGIYSVMVWNIVKLSGQVQEGSVVRTLVKGKRREYRVLKIGVIRHWCKLEDVRTKVLSNMSIAKMIWDGYEIKEKQ